MSVSSLTKMRVVLPLVYTVGVLLQPDLRLIKF